MIGAGVTIKPGAVVRDSIIMQGTVIGERTTVDKAIIAENVTVGSDVAIGVGEEAENVLKPNIYRDGLAVVGENAVIPESESVRIQRLPA